MDFENEITVEKQYFKTYLTCVLEIKYHEFFCKLSEKRLKSRTVRIAT